MEKRITQYLDTIRSVKIQGATNVAEFALDCLKKESTVYLTKNRNIYLNKIKYIAKLLANARPTEPLSRNAVKFVFHYLKLKSNNKSVKETHKILHDACELFKELIKFQEIKIQKYGSLLIKPGMNVLTHCHSSTVENIISQAGKKIKKFKVFTTETRPLLQGRITAKNLLKKGINVTMVVDSSAEFLISKSSGKGLMMNIVFLGADLITSTGSAVNKIGSFGISQTAKDENVPLYVAASLLKMDSETFSNNYVAIELRDGNEIWPNAPKNLKFINFAFDRIPAKSISGIICEFGIIKPKEAAEYAVKNYPWIFNKI